MIKRTEQEIRTKLDELWPKSKYWKYPIEINISDKEIKITLANMYDVPGLSFAQLLALSKFFDSDKIDDVDQNNREGCETCDYGSKYSITLTIKE